MRVATLAAAAVLFSSGPASAQTETGGGGAGGGGGGSFGLGLIIGQPTGITGAFQLSDRTMIDAAIGLDIFDDRDFYVHVEFLYFLPTLVSGSSMELSAYLGIGGFFVNHADAGFGARAPFGLSLDFTAVPLQIFAEASFRLFLTPDVDGDVKGAIGFRYWF